MKWSQRPVRRFGERLIIFGICPALGLLFTGAALFLAFRLVRDGVFDLIAAAMSLVLLLIGLGLLQFSYIIFFRKESKLGSGVITLASFAFMILGLFAAIYPLVVPQDSDAAYKFGRAGGIFFIGVLGLKYARSRKKSEQASSAAHLKCESK